MKKFMVSIIVLSISVTFAFAQGLNSQKSFNSFKQAAEKQDIATLKAHTQFPLKITANGKSRQITAKESDRFLSGISKRFGSETLKNIKYSDLKEKTIDGKKAFVLSKTIDRNRKMKSSSNPKLAERMAKLPQVKITFDFIFSETESGLKLSGVNTVRQKTKRR